MEEKTLEEMTPEEIDAVLDLLCLQGKCEITGVDPETGERMFRITEKGSDEVERLLNTSVANNENTH